MRGGWVVLHKKIVENHFLMHDEKAYVVFTKLLLYANSNGEWSGGRNQLGELLVMNPRTVYDVLKRLQAQQIISLLPNSRYTVIHICNWEKYQHKPNNKLALSPTARQQQPNSTPTARQHSYNNKQVTINKKDFVVDEEKTTRKKTGKGYLAFKKQKALLTKRKELFS